MKFNNGMDAFRTFLVLVLISALTSYLVGSMAAHHELMRLIPEPLRQVWEKQSAEFSIQQRAAVLQKDYLALHPELAPKSTPTLAVPANTAATSAVPIAPVQQPSVTPTPKK